jgi:predicted nucleotide-binding protein
VDLEAQADKVFKPRPETETLRLGLSLARDMGALSSWGPGTNAIDVASFQIAEHIVEIRDPDKVWDDFIAQSTASYEDHLPQQAVSEIDLSEDGTLIGSGGLDKMARTPRDAASVPHRPTISPELALSRLQKLLDQIPDIRLRGHDSPAISTWAGNVKIVLEELYGESSLIFREFRTISFSPAIFFNVQPDSDFVRAFNTGMDEAKGFLESRVNDLSERIEHGKPRSALPSNTHLDSRRIFVVHGHDHGSKETVARFLGQLGLEPIILHEKPDQGKTIIEKFEAHAADARCAVVILTADDVGYLKANPEPKELRARQNVILELGYFVGKLGRDHTFALVEKGLALPSDIHGVVYIPLDEGAWRFLLVKELKAAGLDVDANSAFR